MKNSNVPRGWALKCSDTGQYVSDIISNGHPGSPVVYYTKDLQEAHAFVRCKAAEKRAAQLGVLVVWFVADNDGKRIENGIAG